MRRVATGRHPNPSAMLLKSLHNCSICFTSLTCISLLAFALHHNQPKVKEAFNHEMLVFDSARQSAACDATTISDMYHLEAVVAIVSLVKFSAIIPESVCRHNLSRQTCQQLLPMLQLEN